ncbi:hypothetical protein [Acerihabitans sp.]|uniref:hypothetical protein n=1 Tax=Acerihabitans sp. TaxID=2811394 RepID=UPI002ED935AC
MTVAEQLELKGRQIGWQEGWQEEWQEGWQEGRSERNKEIARSMLAIGLDRATIIQLTGLSDSKLDALADADAL